MRMEQILKEIAVHEAILDALLGVKNRLREVFDLAIHYEMGTWEEFESDAARLGIPEGIVPGSSCNPSIGPAASSPTTTSQPPNPAEF